MPRPRYSRRTVLSTLGHAAASQVLLRTPVAWAASAVTPGQQGLAAIPSGPPGMELTVTVLTSGTLRISIAASKEDLDRYYDDGSIAARDFTQPVLRKSIDTAEQTLPWGPHTVHVRPQPLRIALEHATFGIVQELTFRPDLNQIQFSYGNAPVYGMGPGVHPMDRRGVKDPMRNGAGDNLRIFGARNPIPWIMGQHWGVFFHEPGGQFDLSGDTGVFRPSDVARGQDLFFCLGKAPADLLREYAEITGFPHLPALWTFGFQQSHRTLDSREQIIEEGKTFRAKQLPCDAMIYLGTGFCPSGWNTGHGSFAFNDKVFPEPAAMLREFHDLHLKVVLHVVNPPENLHGRATETGSATAEPGDAANYWQQHVPFVQMGVDGWWPDEGDLLPTASRLVRNRMYWEGGRLTDPAKRPFALHRNCYAGIQRWGWLWSGDTFSTWKTLEAQISMGISAGLSGVPFWGTDIGGFVPTKEFTAELFVRWFQFGAFCPSFRCHGRTWQLRRPWGWNTGSYGPSEMGPNAGSILPRPEDLHNTAVEPICRKFLNLRMQLLPYLYSAAWETHTTGMPLIRSLGLAYPDDPHAWEVADAYLFGPGLLVAPIFTQAATERSVYLPAGQWFDFWTGAAVQGGKAVEVTAPLESMPLLVRAGAMVPMGPVKQHSAEAISAPLLLTVYPGADGSYTLYEDDGLSFAYEQGSYNTTELHWSDSTRTLRYRGTRNGHGQTGEILVSLPNGKRHKITPGADERSLVL